MSARPSARTPRPRAPPGAPRPRRSRPRRRTRRRTSASRSAPAASRDPRATVTPLPAASPSAFTTARPPNSSTNASAFSTSVNVPERAVGIPCRSHSSFAHAFEPSSARRASRRPEHREPRASQLVGQTGDERRLGADHGEVDVLAFDERDDAVDVVGAHGHATGDRAIPALPGAASRSSTERALRAAARRARAPAPPPPTTRTFIRPAGSARARVRPRRPTTGTPTSSSIRWTYARAGFGQVLERRRLVDLLHPALELLVDRLGLVEERLVRREVVERLALGAVRRCRSVTRLEPGQDVELGDEQLGQPVHARRVPPEHRVEPAAAALATGRRSRTRCPRSPSRSPTSSTSSVGNGPAPTRVTYAFTMPITRSTSRGPMPADASA